MFDGEDLFKRPEEIVTTTVDGSVCVLNLCYETDHAKMPNCLNYALKKLNGEVLNVKYFEESVQRRHLMDEREALTHKFDISGHKGFITYGLFPDGTLGEIFITMSKRGSTMRGMLDTIATLISIGLQYNVPLEVLCEKFERADFPPKGYTRNTEIQQVTSVIDYLFKWLRLKFLTQEEK